jgi:hypothetical protein
VQGTATDSRCAYLSCGFTSRRGALLPAADTYDAAFNASFSDFAALGGDHGSPGGNPAFALPDRDIESNRRFEFTVCLPHGTAGSKRAVLLLHGLNERTWGKYRPWAEFLAVRLDRPVVLFPLAFHVNRSLPQWGDPRLMRQVSRERQRSADGIRASSFVNAAISTRLQAVPQRFFLSGLQSVGDLTDWMDGIRAGAYPLFDRECAVDIFGYSVGAMVTEVLLTSDGAGRFADARACLFCGGATFDRMQPVTRFILDSEAHRALLAVYVERFGEVVAGDPIFAAQMEADGAACAFARLLALARHREERTRALAALRDRLSVIALAEDAVVTPAAVDETFRDTGVPVESLDLPFAYRHEDPFPGPAGTELLRGAYAAVFGRVVDALA